MAGLLVLAFFISALPVSCQQNRSAAKAPAHILFRDSFPQPTGYVNDYENIFSATEENVLDSLIGYIEKSDSLQIAVISFDTSMVEKDSLDDLTLRIANEWGVGHKNKNNGITIGICIGHRRIRIQNGFGIEPILTNDETKKIIDTVFIPAFADRQFFKGTFDGINALVVQIKRNRQQ